MKFLKIKALLMTLLICNCFLQDTAWGEREKGKIKITNVDCTTTSQFVVYSSLPQADCQILLNGQTREWINLPSGAGEIEVFKNDRFGQLCGYNIDPQNVAPLFLLNAHVGAEVACKMAPGRSNYPVCTCTQTN